MSAEGGDVKPEIERVDREALVQCIGVEGNYPLPEDINRLLKEHNITRSRIVDIKLSESMAMDSSSRDNFNRTCLIFYV